MAIIGTMEDTRVPLELDGFPLAIPGNSAYVRYAGTAIIPYMYSDPDGWVHSASSYVGVYDPETHEEAAAVELPCPGLTAITQDEDGYTYLAHEHSPVSYLYGDWIHSKGLSSAGSNAWLSGWNTESSAWPSPR